MCAIPIVTRSQHTQSHGHHSKEHHGPSLFERVDKAVVVKGIFFNETQYNDRWGTLNDMNKREDEEMLKFKVWLNETMPKVHPYSDGEDVDAVIHFFWGKRDGIVLELGALDGITFSESKNLEDLGWQRVLIEGDPSNAAKLKENAPNSLSFSTAVCSIPHQVHYIKGEGDNGAVGGIIEFMTPTFLSGFHQQLLGKTRAEWSQVKGVVKISCLPMSDMLTYAHLTHINLFILDVEGAELSVLKTIDFSAVWFDVISVETESGFREVGNLGRIVAFLLDKNYKYVGTWGRNSWFRHAYFEPSACKDCQTDWLPEMKKIKDAERAKASANAVRA